MRFPPMWYVRQAKAQTSLIRAFASRLSMTIKLLTEYHLGFLSLNESTKARLMSIHVKIPHCWKSHVAAHFCLLTTKFYKSCFTYLSNP